MGGYCRPLSAWSWLGSRYSVLVGEAGKSGLGFEGDWGLISDNFVKQ